MLRISAGAYPNMEMNMATKKASKKKSPAKRATSKGPSKSDFIREKLKAGMSAADIIKAGAEHKVTIAPSMVYKLKSTLGGKKTSSKGKPRPKFTGRRRGASEWVRQQLAAGKSPADIWAEAQRIKMKFSRNLIYTVKSADGSAKDKPGPKPRNILTVNFEGSAVEEQFKTLVAKIGLSRAAELIQEATSWGRAFGVVKY